MASGGWIQMPMAMAGWTVILCTMLLGDLRGVTSSEFCQEVIQPLQVYGCTEHTVQTDDGFVLVMHRLSHTAKNSSTRTKHARKHHGRKTDKNLRQTTRLGQEPPVHSASLITGNSVPSGARARPNESPQSFPSNYSSHPEEGKGAPVLLMHQEMLNGDSWFESLDDQHQRPLLPAMLLDDGFDVWIGHQRATYWGHDHVSLHYNDRAYWDWTWDEHAQYDLPAQLRFITAETNQTVHYIGASQAATVGAAGATDPQTAHMLRSLTLIGPTAYRGNTNSLLLDAWAYYFGFALDMEYYTTGYQNGAFNFSREFPQAGPITGNGASGRAIGLISGPNCCLGSAAIQLDNGWDGTTSYKNLLHWQQGIRTNSFAHYSYSDAQRNMAAYGQATAPNYNPAQIPRKVPILVIAGGRDWTSPPRGTIMFLNALQEPAELINLTNYAHYDLTFSLTRDNDVYMPILNFLGGAQFH